MKKTLLSFRHAFLGLLFLFRTQRNAQIHLAALLMVIILGIHLHISSQEWFWLMGISGLVLTAEAFNTSIEQLTDIASPRFSIQAGRVKDLAAGAVLLSAITAVVVGLMIFGPKL